MPEHHGFELKIFNTPSNDASKYHFHHWVGAERAVQLVELLPAGGSVEVTGLPLVGTGGRYVGAIAYFWTLPDA